VTAEQFTEATRNGQASEVFGLARPGLVLFDDVDLALRDREQFGATADHSTFLAGLDGVDVRHGVVYVFTSNAELCDLDPAFRRPGRIDVVMHFPAPNAALRRQILDSRWPGEMLRGLNPDRVVRETEGLSFAELEELRKLLVLRYLDTQAWDWRRAWSDFETGRGPAQRSGIGFLEAVRPRGVPAVA
jgi:SpoVK/Ycf46/Vps4 family AAA+-type ATPase